MSRLFLIRNGTSSPGGPYHFTDLPAQITGFSKLGWHSSSASAAGDRLRSSRSAEKDCNCVSDSSIYGTLLGNNVDIWWKRVLSQPCQVCSAIRVADAESARELDVWSFSQVGKFVCAAWFTAKMRMQVVTRPQRALCSDCGKGCAVDAQYSLKGP